MGRLSFLLHFYRFCSVAKSPIPKSKAYCGGMEATRSNSRLRYRYVCSRYP